MESFDDTSYFENAADPLKVNWDDLVDVLDAEILVLRDAVIMATGGPLSMDCTFTPFTNEAAEALVTQAVGGEPVTARSHWYPAETAPDALIMAYADLHLKAQVGDLIDAMRASALSQIALFPAEAFTAISQQLDRENYGNNPYRDHISHVVLVFCAGSFLLKQRIEDYVLHSVVEQTKLSDTWKAMEDICKVGVGRVDPQLGDKLNDVDFIRKVVLVAWLVAAFCHDMCYVEEIEARVEKRALRQQFFKCSSEDSSMTKLTTQRFQTALDRLAGPDEDLWRKLRDLLGLSSGEEPRELAVPESGYNHGKAAAAMLLSYFTCDEALEGLRQQPEDDLDGPPGVELPALILACQAIHDHDLFGKGVELPLEEMEARATKYWKQNPMGVLLTISDLMAEGLRVGWEVWHQGRKSEQEDDSEGHRRLMGLESFIGFPEMHVREESDDILVEYVTKGRDSCPGWPEAVKEADKEEKATSGCHLCGGRFEKPSGKDGVVRWDAFKAVHGGLGIPLEPEGLVEQEKSDWQEEQIQLFCFKPDPNAEDAANELAATKFLQVRKEEPVRSRKELWLTALWREASGASGSKVWLGLTLLPSENDAGPDTPDATTTAAVA